MRHASAAAIAVLAAFAAPPAGAQTIQVETMQFFESGESMSQQEIDSPNSVFNQTQARYINVKLTVKNLRAGYSDNSVSITFVYYYPDGSVMGRPQLNYTIPSSWSSAFLYKGFGWKTPGEWQPGRYRVEGYTNGAKICEGAFTVNDNRPQGRGVEFASLQFFEGPYEHKKDDRRNLATVFEKTNTRYIYTMVTFKNNRYKVAEQQVKMVFHLFRPDGKPFDDPTPYETTMPMNSSEHLYWSGWGWEEPGWWSPGVYRGEIHLQGTGKVGEATFTIHDDRILEVRQAEEFYDAKDWQAAIDAYNKAIPKDAKFADRHYYYRGWAKYGLENYSDAIEDFTRAIQKNPKQAGRYYEARATTKKAMDDHQGAIDDYTSAMEISPAKAAYYCSKRAWVRIDLKDYDGAIADFTEAIRLDPKDAADQYDNRAWTKNEKGDYAGAVVDYGKAMDLNPSKSGYYLGKRAWARHSNEDYDGAIKDFTRAIELDPASAPGHYSNRAYMKKSKGDLKGAIEDYTRAIDADPKKAADHLVSRSELHEEMGDRAKADADLERAIQISTGDPKKQSDYYGKRAARRAGRGDTADAIADFDKSLELDPTDTWMQYQRRQAKLKSGDFAGAIADETLRIEEEPTVAAYQARAGIRESMGDFDGAIADHEKAIDLKPSEGGSYKSRASARAAKGDFAGALADYVKAVELSPKDFWTLSACGEWKVFLGRHDEAVADATKWIDAHARDANGYDKRADWKRAKGDLDGAIADYLRAVELDPKSDWRHYWAPHTMTLKGDYEGAIEYETKRIAAKAKDGEACNARGDWKMEIGRFDEALADYREALSLKPKSVPFRDDFVRGCLAAGDLDASLKECEKIIAKKPREAAGYLLRASVRRTAGELREAAGDFAKCIELAPGASEYYAGRAMLLLAGGQPAEAAGDLRKACQLNAQFQHWNRITLLVCESLASDPKTALENYRRFVKERPVQANHEFQKAVSQYIADDLGDDAFFRTVDALDAKSRDYRFSRSNRARGHYYAGLKRKAAGDARGAVDHFRKCITADYAGAIIEDAVLLLRSEGCSTAADVVLGMKTAGTGGSAKAGVLVTNVDAGGLAARAGLEKGDTLLGVGDAHVNVHSLDGLLRGALKIRSQTVFLKVLRNGKELKARLRLTPLIPQPKA